MLSIIISGTYSICWYLIRDSKTILDWIGLGVAIYFIAFLVYTFLRFIRRKIVLYEDRIFVLEDMGGKEVKIQYEVDLSFAEIENVYLEISNKNSLNKNMRWVITPMLYIVFDLNDGTKARINVYFYSKKQVISIIDYIIEKKKQIDPIFSNPTGYELISELSKQKSIL